MFLYGAGGHARVVLEILEAHQILIDGFFDDGGSISELLGYPVRKYTPGMTTNGLLLAIVTSPCNPS